MARRYSTGGGTEEDTGIGIGCTFALLAVIVGGGVLCLISMVL